MKINTKKLEAERKRLKLSMRGFSKRFGLEASTYRKICEAESTTLKTLTKIASILRIDPRDLLLR